MPPFSRAEFVSNTLRETRWWAGAREGKETRTHFNAQKSIWGDVCRNDWRISLASCLAEKEGEEGLGQGGGGGEGETITQWWNSHTTLSSSELEESNLNLTTKKKIQFSSVHWLLPLQISHPRPPAACPPRERDLLLKMVVIGA